MSEHGRIRRRLPRSCRRCHRRKQRCVGYPTCANCESAQVACARSETVPSWHHAMSKEALVRRIETLEAQLAATADKPTPSPERDDTWSDLGLSADDPDEPAYLGPSPGLSITTNLSQILHDVFWARSIPVCASYQCSDPAPSPDIQCNYEGPEENEGAQLLQAYWDTMHLRFPFLRPQELLKCHAERAKPLGSRPQDRVGRFKLYLVYGIGASVRQMNGATNITPPSVFRAMAREWEPALSRSSWRDQAEGLLLLSLYQLRWSSTSRVWHWLGQAMRICTDHGLHSKSQYETLPPCEAQRHLRLFWSVYIVERYFCWATGRPFSIDESEINADLPIGLDMEGNISTIDVSRQEPGLQRFIACIQLQRIASVIKNRFYRVDSRSSTLLPDIAPFMTALERYQETLLWLPPDDREFIQMHWNNSIRVLLQPFVDILPPTDPLMQTCLAASGKLCQSFRKLQQRGSGYGFLLANTIFVAGLTMCFCLLRSPHLWTISASNDLRACSSAMSLMAQHNPTLRRYRDSLETIIDRTMNMVAETALTPEDTVLSMDQFIKDLNSSQTDQCLGLDPCLGTFDIESAWREASDPSLSTFNGSEDRSYWEDSAQESIEKGLLDHLFVDNLWSDDGMILCIPPPSVENTT